jgi:hypothetical protein
MRTRTSGTHFGSNPNGFHDFFRRSVVPLGDAGMTADAIRTLCHVCHGHGDQLLGLRGKRPFGKHALTESLESLGRFRGQILRIGAMKSYLGSLSLPPIRIRINANILSCQQLYQIRG